NSATMVKPIARPIGDGGVSTISSAAGKNASSPFSRRLAPRGSEMTFLTELLADFMDSGLQAMERGITAACVDQIVVGAILHDPASIDSDNPVGAPNG